jgi:hypothetical protein
MQRVQIRGGNRGSEVSEGWVRVAVIAALPAAALDQGS